MLSWDALGGLGHGSAPGGMLMLFAGSILDVFGCFSIPFVYALRHPNLIMVGNNHNVQIGPRGCFETARALKEKGDNMESLGKWKPSSRLIGGLAPHRPAGIKTILFGFSLSSLKSINQCIYKSQCGGIVSEPFLSSVLRAFLFFLTRVKRSSGLVMTKRRSEANWLRRAGFALGLGRVSETSN